MSSDTFTYDVTNRPVLSVHFDRPGSLRPLIARGGTIPKPAFRALIDTGADVTSISADVAARAGLRVISKGVVRSATGEEVVNAYLGDVAFLLKAGAEDRTCLVEATTLLELAHPQGSIDALLGRDVLDYFVLTVDGPQKTFTIRGPD